MKPYESPGPSVEDVDTLAGPLLLEFGTDWCGHCQAAAAAIAEALSDYPTVHHIKVEDGPGRRLGRFFRVKLWPTVIALQDGKEIARVVRPETAEEIRRALAQLGLKAGGLREQRT
jgi:thioredoxin 1